MRKVVLYIATSLDGYIASPTDPLSGCPRHPRARITGTPTS
ncbi:hypothetical protein [Hymenobacter sp. 5516J-16]|nr:hypothetical protein [Hymenobacter sp. 5516J-16]